MARVHDGGNHEFWFMCPGCGSRHRVLMDARNRSWNGDFDLPTITGDIHTGTARHTCRSYITKGRILYLADSTHALAGQTVDLPEWKPW
jgi:hypothetical protein